MTKGFLASAEKEIFLLEIMWWLKLMIPLDAPKHFSTAFTNKSIHHCDLQQFSGIRMIMKNRRDVQVRKWRFMSELDSIVRYAKGNPSKGVRNLHIQARHMKYRNFHSKPLGQLLSYNTSAIYANTLIT